MTAPLEPYPLRHYLRHGMLPQLAALEAVVRLGSARRAAEALCIAQPTLSGHLRKLSEALDVQLFEIRGKRLVPTHAALVVLQSAHEVFAAFERCDRALTGLRGGEGLVSPATPPARQNEILAGTGSTPRPAWPP